MKDKHIKDKYRKIGDDNMERSTKKKILLLAIVSLAVIGSVTYSIQYYQAEGQNLSLGQLGNLIEPINPQATVVRDTLANVNGTALSELSKTSSSGTIERVNGTSKQVEKTGQAELSLSYGLTPNDQQIISTTITNTGTQKFYIIGLLIKGGTIIPETGAGGVQNLDAYVVDTGYSPEVWGDIPKPPITEPVVLNPGESFTGYITGKWTEDLTQKAINSFSVGGTYVYNIDATGYEPGNGWSISITDVKLP